ncbi:MAG: FdtA/QdtA family cupin domain-containing protein [Cytophagaceae bacterium]|jgi:hypothetical protein|nr:FdtA/QdtA family cupin domain-containing protein [Cytophagaceae bacterium]
MNIHTSVANKPALPTVFDCHIYQLPQISTVTGKITAVHNEIDIPFNVRRVFYLYDIPAGENRGAHSHFECHQFLIAASGSFEVMVDDGRHKKTLFLNQPFMGLHIPPGIWACEQNFSSGSICLVMTSHPYNENDYIRTYEKYLEYREI